MEHTGSGGFEVGGQGKYSVSVPTCSHVYDDVVFFLSESEASSTKQVTSRHYARAALVFLAFYFESLANLLFDEVGKSRNCQQELELIYGRQDHYSRPLRKFRAVYFVLYEHELPLDISGIQDLFSIRNQVIVHPPATSTIAGTDVTEGKGLTGDGKHLSLSKFTHFPNIYGEFASVHTKEVYNETKNFLEKYCALVATKLPNAIVLYYLRRLKEL